MKRKALLVVIGVLLLGLGLLSLTRGARRIPNRPYEQNNFTVVADLPKTNAPAAPAPTRAR